MVASDQEIIRSQQYGSTRESSGIKMGDGGKVFRRQEAMLKFKQHVANVSSGVRTPVNRKGFEFLNAVICDSEHNFRSAYKSVQALNRRWNWLDFDSEPFSAGNMKYTCTLTIAYLTFERDSLEKMNVPGSTCPTICNASMELQCACLDNYCKA